MKILTAFVFLCYALQVNAQPRLVVRPAASATPLGFHTKHDQIYLRDPLNIKVFDWANAQLSAFQIPGMQISETSMDGAITAFGNFNEEGFQVFLYNTQNGQSKVFKGKGDLVGLHISAGNQYLAVEAEETVTLFSIETGAKTGTYIKKHKESRSCSFNDKNLLAAGENEIEVLSVPGLKVIDKIPFSGNFHKFSNNGRYYMANPNIYETGTKKLLFTLNNRVSIFSFPYDNTPVISPDGKQVAVFYNYGKYIFAVYDMASGKELLKKDLSEEIGNLTSAMFFQIDPKWRFFAIANQSNGLTLFDLKTGEEKCQIYSIGSEDILIKIPDGHYMATRRGAFEGVNFELDGEIFDFIQFDQQFNRPDLVLAHIGLTPAATLAAFKKAYDRRLARLKENGAVIADDFNKPTVVFKHELPVFTDKTSVELSVLANDPKEILDRINVYVNGTPVYGRNGFSIRNKKSQSYLHTVTLRLTPGDNRIEVDVINQKQAVSQRIQSFVQCEMPESKPDLHLVTIGVAQYREADKNLVFATRDAQSVDNLFTRENNLYGQVFTYKLWESDFSIENLKKVRQALQRTKETDQVIIFYAGHGLVDNNLNYYLGSTDLNFSNPSSNGISYNLLESLLDSIPARKKLLLLDACFSGEIDKNVAQRIRQENTVQGAIRLRSSDTGLTAGNTEEERAFNLMREWFADLTISTGATVLASAGGLQNAIEGEKWKNGVFTWCLHEGLSSKKADANQDGKIMLSELRDYLESAVPNQTNRQQQPTFRTENLVADWPIW